MKKATALTIAGTDSSGGAGVQADLKTMLANGVYGMSAITALTAQNTLGVLGISEVSIDFLHLELQSVFEDIFPDAVKIGMVSSVPIIQEIARSLRHYGARNIVVDPVMVATSGSKLISDDAKEALCEELFPLATVITPNILEAQELTGRPIRNEEDMVQAGRLLQRRYRVNTLIKGGHSIQDANDLLVTAEEETWFAGEKIKNPNTHGTGCTLSSAIAAYLALGRPLPSSIHLAKRYISEALKAMLDLGRGAGPLDHGYRIRPLED